MAKERCFACNKILGKNPKMVDTRDDQKVYVGAECYKRVVQAGERGYKCPNAIPGEPRLYPIKASKPKSRVE